MPTISALPTPPQRTDNPDTFITKSDAFVNALPQFVLDANALASNLNSIAAGGAYSIPYLIDLTGTTNTDPGNGRLRFNSATQSSATTLYLDVLNVYGSDVSGLIDQLTASNSIVKGKLRLVKQTDPTKYLTFDVTGVTNYGGYRGVQVSSAWGSSPNPFAATDAVLMFFERSGDVGTQGSLFRRVSYLANNSAAVTPDLTATDVPTVNGLTLNLTINAPTTSSAFNDCQQITFRIRDNGIARTLAWNVAYRAGTDLALPTSTVAGKMVYVGFMYNAIDLKWDLIAVTGNI